MRAHVRDGLRALRSRTFGRIAAVCVATACALAPAGPAFALAVTVPPASPTPPTGFQLSPRTATALAARVPQVETERARGRLEPHVAYDASHVWSVEFFRAGKPLVLVTIFDGTRRVRSVYTGAQVTNPLARGEHGALARRLHWILLAAAFLFVVPFLDPRRPLRALHLDLAALLAFGVVHLFFAAGNLDVAVPLRYPLMLYLIARVLWLATHRPQRPAELVPRASERALAIALAAVVVAHLCVNLFGGFGVIDNGYDSVWGANTLRGGWELYARSAFPLNVYGPVTYLAYVPFEAVFPLDAGWQRDFLAAAHAATLTFDLVTIAGLVVLGRRLRPGREGTLLGLALAYAFAAYPYTVAVLTANSNDFLVPALVVWALVFASSRGVRGVLLGLATAAKFFPLPFLPVFARTEGEGWSVRAVATYAAVVAAVFALAVVPYLPHPGGLNQFLDVTVRSQTHRDDALALWGAHPSLHFLQPLLRAATALLGIALFFVPRRRDVVTLAAATAAVVIAEQVTLDHWYHLYISWFAPFALIVFLAAAYPARDAHELRSHRRTEEHPAARA